MAVQAGDGRSLTRAIAWSDGEGRVLELVDVEDPSALLMYLFDRGERWVVLECKSLRFHGRLDTRWLGTGRAWWAELEVPPHPQAR